MRVWVLLVALCILRCQLCQSANILAVTLLASPSHHIWNEAYLKELVKKGHNVTILTHDQPKFKHPNYTAIIFEDVYKETDQNFSDFTTLGPLDTISLLWDYTNEVCEHDLGTQGLKTILRYPADYKFDLIIWDVNLGQCVYPLIKRFGNPPVIGTSPFSAQHAIQDMMGQHMYSYIPYFMSHATDKMTFMERLKNFIYITSMNLSRRMYVLRYQYRLAEERFGNNIQPFEEIERNISLLLINADLFSNYPQPYAPNIIPVGGLHIPRENNKLPVEIQKIYDESEGVILFSLGSNVQPDKLGEDKFNMFLTAFSKLPFTILWKCNCIDIKKPKNVHIMKWLPQHDILAHPKTILFFTHGGALSTQEAMYYGVPVVALPIFLDQHFNAETLVYKGLGKILHFDSLSAESIEETVLDVISNPLYRHNMLSLSKKYRDRPIHPADLAVYWTEYILRHGSAAHFDIAARDMYFYETMNLDILVVLSFIVLLILVMSYKLISKILKCTDANKQTDLVKKNQ